MNEILNKVSQQIHENIRRYLPDVTLTQLEGNGAVYYMNGNNGTEFDWYVNNRFPYFMVFYNTKENLGAAKMGLYTDGTCMMVLYGNNGKEPVQQLSFTMECNPDELLQLAVLLRQAADENRIWDADIRNVNTDEQPELNAVETFASHESLYEETRARQAMLPKRAIVSRRVLHEGWSIGIMTRDNPRDETDSGWYFGAGNESEQYMDDPRNFVMVSIGYLWQNVEPQILKYVLLPAGTQLIRVAPDVFEEDNGKDICCRKRETRS